MGHFIQVHSKQPEDSEFAARVAQPLAQQPDTCVSQGVVGQIKVCEGLVDAQGRRNVLTSFACEAAAVEPQFLESAGGVSQPLTQQGHAAVSQVIKAQVQLPKVGADPKHSRETLTGHRTEPTNAEPGKTLSTGESCLISSEVFWGKERG